jgi:hypothetical protein
MDSNTPNIHTPPEGHAPPPPQDDHGHESANHQCEHHHDDCENKHHLCNRADRLCEHAHHLCEHSHYLCEHKRHSDSPTVILGRRFAEGQITKEEYLAANEVLLRK